ncbi:MAG: hypothetical protein RLZZ272_138 [Actinomycetota bacterium]|jgi:RNA polymerase sigma-70 factor (ECF subfamily)
MVEADELLVAAGRGDEGAFSELYGRVGPVVLGAARRVLRDPAMAEEVAQEVLLEVWRKASGFDPERGSATGWIGTMARRRAVDRVRSEQSARDRDHRVAVRDGARPFDEVAEEVETRLEHDRVRRAIAGLSQVQREAIELAYFRGHTYREVARLLDVPEGTAKSRLRDGLERLRTELAAA